MLRKFSGFSGFFGLLLAASAHSAEIVIQEGVTDSGVYGNKHPAPLIRVTDELTVSFSLEDEGPVSFSVVGYDIDFPDEVSITINGQTLFLEAVKVNNGYSPEVSVDFGTLSAGAHSLIIKNTYSPKYKWAVTNLSLTQEVSPDPEPTGLAFELLDEVGCEVGQLLRATALGWECVDERPCPVGVSHALSPLESILELDPSLSTSGVSISDSTDTLYCRITWEAQFYAAHFERGDDWPYWPILRYRNLDDAFHAPAEFLWSWSFQYPGELESCTKDIAQYCPCFFGLEGC